MANSIYPPAYDTPVGMVRNLISDTVQRKDPKNPTSDAEYLFEDARIASFLSINNGNVRLASADCIDAIADNESLVSKKIRTEDLQTDGPAVTNALRLHATSLRAQAKREQEDEDMAGGMDIVDYVYRPDVLPNCYSPFIEGTTEWR